VEIQYNVATVADEDASLSVDAELLNSLDLFEERVDMNNATASNEILTLRAHNTRRQNVNVELFVVMNDGVTSIVATLSPTAELCLAAKDIDELTFAFITPLGT